jgi:poly-gamma-glutamate capsule biosynthesis protein CapA/YwtB (metallophosphatase superfamily)
LAAVLVAVDGRTVCAGLADVLLVDAANAIGSRPDGWWRDRPGAARRLVAQLRAGILAGHLEPPVIVVLEGAARSGAPEADADGVGVRHAPASGDDLLVELAAAARPAPVVVVSSDRELRRRVALSGASAVGPTWLFARLDPR